MTRSLVGGYGLLTVALLFAACGGGGEPSPPTAVPTSSLLPPASDTHAAPAATAPAATAPSDTASPAATAPAATSAAVLVDESLIDYLPVEVAGIALTSDPATAGTIAADPDLAASASSIAVALAIAPGASVGDDVAVVSVVKLKPGVFDAEFFRSWRDSYDKAACEAAGGTAGNAHAVIGGKETDIGTCAAGAHTYHVYLEASNVIVSVTSVGDLRLGEQIVAGLRE